MDKRLKKKKGYRFKVDCEKYASIGKKAARNPVSYSNEDGITVNYIGYDNVGLEFYEDGDITYARDIKGNANLENSLNDRWRVDMILCGFYMGLKKQGQEGD